MFSVILHLKFYAFGIVRWENLIAFVEIYLAMKILKHHLLPLDILTAKTAQPDAP